MAELPLNTKAQILEVNDTNKFVKRRLYEMGLTKDMCVKLKKIAPLGSPLVFELRGYELGLRIESLKNISVRIVE